MMIRFNKGFTLVELIIVLAIIGVLVTIMLIAVNPVRIIQDSRDAKYRTEMNQIRTALQLYFNDENGYPSGSCAGPACVTGALGVLISGGYAKALPDVVSDPSFNYDSENSTDYDAGVTLNNAEPPGDDGHTVSKCTSDGSSPSGGGDYMVCPD